MKACKTLIFTLLLASSHWRAGADPGTLGPPVGSNDKAISNNPFLVNFNELNDFAILKYEHVLDAVDSAINSGNEMVAKIVAIKNDNRNFGNTIEAQDDISALTARIINPIYLMSQTHTDPDIRAICDSAIIKFEKWSNELMYNEKLYRTVKDYAANIDAKNLTGIKKFILSDYLKNYKRIGMDLPQEKRDTLKSIRNRMSEIGLEFTKNISEYTDTLIVSEKEMEGLPDWYIKKYLYPDGQYKIDISYPARKMFMKYSKSESARKALTEKYLNRGIDNLDVIPRLVQEHHNLAGLLGYQSYAEYLLDDRMPKTPDRVWEFEADLRKNLQPKADAEKKEMLWAKNALTGSNDNNINYWNMFYYENYLDEHKYRLDQEQIKDYFELNNVLSGMFTITQKMLGLEFQKIDDPSVWHPDVTMYSVYDNDSGALLGYFYLDLFPREGKFSHAAHFGISKGKKTKNGYQMPIAALVCNFPKPSPDRPSLLNHGPNGDVETFFHEFGHLLHGMVTGVDYWDYSGTSVDRDFVEAPSQIFENWVWEKEALNLFAKHYKTGELIPQDLLERMLAAKNRSAGNNFLFQVYLGSLDMTLYDQWNPNGQETVLEVSRRLMKEILIFNETPNTARVANFGHLNGYAASYYGYAWSKVLAQDMYSVFKAKGVLNPEIGKRFRDQVLSKGGSKEPMELVKDFIGRKPNSNALVESLGL